MIFNTIQHGNHFSSSYVYGLRAQNQATPKLVVISWLSNNGRSSSTPMIGHTNSNIGTGGLNWIGSTIGSSMPSIGSVVDLPDMLISQRKNYPYRLRDLRQTIFHEYGHSLHYFKVGDIFWGANIQKSVSASDYGSSITSDPGNFFSLTEGWADYIGELYAQQIYGPALVFNENDPATGLDDFGDYYSHLENIKTFYNKFIPRGLYYDLIDGYDSAEPWDSLSATGPVSYTNYLTLLRRRFNNLNRHGSQRIPITIQYFLSTDYEEFFKDINFIIMGLFWVK